VTRLWRGRTAPGDERRDPRMTCHNPTVLLTQQLTYRDYRQRVGNFPRGFLAVAKLVASLLEVVVWAVESDLPPCLHLAVGSCKGVVRVAATSVASPPMIVIWDVELSLPR
jgi:hypothetical protein